MDKQKTIEEMAMIALKNTLSYTCAKQIATNFYNAGYGDLRKFAEALKEQCEKHERKIMADDYQQDAYYFAIDMSDFYMSVNETLNEFLGARVE